MHCNTNMPGPVTNRTYTCADPNLVFVASYHHYQDHHNPDCHAEASFCKWLSNLFSKVLLSRLVILCQHNTLARKAPEVAQFWDAEKNHPMSPAQVTVNSHMRAHWKCSACLHKWQASVLNKACGKSGCPKCAKANGGRKADGTRQKHPTFAAAQHPLLQQWDHDRNQESGNFPDNTSLQSNKLIWWQCHECLKGKVHSWQARAYNRTAGKTSSGCPCCAGRQLCECNSLETVCPDIAADFDVEQNGVTAAEVTSSTTTKYSWLSDGPEAKRRSVDQRTSHTRRKFNTEARRS